MSEPEPKESPRAMVGVFRMGVKVEVATEPDMPLTPFEIREKVVHVTRDNEGVFFYRTPGLPEVANADLLNGLWSVLRA